MWISDSVMGLTPDSTRLRIRTVGSYGFGFGIPPPPPPTLAVTSNLVAAFIRGLLLKPLTFILQAIIL